MSEHVDGLHALCPWPGLYRVVTPTFVAGFVVDEYGELSACAPILRRRLLSWARRAQYVCA